MIKFKTLIIGITVWIVLANVALAQQPKSISLTFDAGVSSVTLSGNFKSILSEPARFYVENKGRDTFRVAREDNIDLGSMDGSAFRVGLRIAKQFSEHVVVFGALDFLRTSVSTGNVTTGVIPVVDTSGTVITQWNSKSQSASLSLSEFDLRPMVRYQPWDSTFYLQGGVAAGMIIGQSASYARNGTLPDGQVDTFPRSASSTHVGDTRFQLALVLGAGFNIELTDDLSAELGVNGRYGLTSLLQTMNLQSKWSLEAALGLTYRLW